MVSLCSFAEAAGESSSHTGAAVVPRCCKAGGASHFPKTAAVDTRRYIVAKAAAAEAAVCVHNMPRPELGAVNTAGTLR